MVSATTKWILCIEEYVNDSRNELFIFGSKYLFNILLFLLYLETEVQKGKQEYTFLFLKFPATFWYVGFSRLLTKAACCDESKREPILISFYRAPVVLWCIPLRCPTELNVIKAMQSVKQWISEGKWGIFLCFWAEFCFLWVFYPEWRSPRSEIFIGSTPSQAARVDGWVRSLEQWHPHVEIKQTVRRTLAQWLKHHTRLFSLRANRFVRKRDTGTHYHTREWSIAFLFAKCCTNRSSCS